jgi:hypothetical protein
MTRRPSTPGDIERKRRIEANARDALRRLKGGQSYEDWRMVGQQMLVITEEVLGDLNLDVWDPDNRTLALRFTKRFEAWEASVSNAKPISKQERWALRLLMTEPKYHAFYSTELVGPEQRKVNHPNKIIERYNRKYPDPNKPKKRQRPVSSVKNNEIAGLKAHVAELEAARDTAPAAVAITGGDIEPASAPLTIEQHLAALIAAIDDGRIIEALRKWREEKRPSPDARYDMAIELVRPLVGKDFVGMGERDMVNLEAAGRVISLDMPRLSSTPRRVRNGTTTRARARTGKGKKAAKAKADGRLDWQDTTGSGLEAFGLRQRSFKADLAPGKGYSIVDDNSNGQRWRAWYGEYTPDGQHRIREDDIIDNVSLKDAKAACEAHYAGAKASTTKADDESAAVTRFAKGDAVWIVSRDQHGYPDAFKNCGIVRKRVHPTDYRVDQARLGADRDGRVRTADDPPSTWRLAPPTNHQYHPADLLPYAADRSARLKQLRQQWHADANAPAEVLATKALAEQVQDALQLTSHSGRLLFLDEISEPYDFIGVDDLDEAAADTEPPEMTAALLALKPRVIEMLAAMENKLDRVDFVSEMAKPFDQIKVVGRVGTFAIRLPVAPPSPDHDSEQDHDAEQDR